MRNKSVGVGVANTNSIVKDVTKFIILVRIMSEKRFKLIKGVKLGTHSGIWDNRKQHNIGIGDELWIGEVVAMLNEGVALAEENKELKKENEQLRKYNGQLKERLEKINKGYGHLTHRNGLTANEWLIESQERELQKKNEQISDWIEQHSNDIVKIGEQQDNINRLEEENEQLKIESQRLKNDCSILVQSNQEYRKENEQLKSQLYCDDEEGVCNICKHHYLVKDNKIELGYYNSRCRKGHYECARVSLKHCEDFEKELGE